MTQYCKREALNKLSTNLGSALAVSTIVFLIGNAIRFLMMLFLFASGIYTDAYAQVINSPSELTDIEIYDIMYEKTEQFFKAMLPKTGFVVFLVIFILIIIAITFVICSVQVGARSYFIELINTEKKPALSKLFSYFSKIFKTWVLYLLMTLLTFIGLFLLIVPGIIIYLSISMAPFIFAENPEISPIEAIIRSVKMMKGHFFELFLLEISFLGWILLSYICTCSIANILVIPYKLSAETVFYLEISGTGTTGSESEETSQYQSM